MKCSDVEYPRELPLDCIREIIRIVRGGMNREEIPSLAKHVWVTQGYLQGLGLGEPDQVIGAVTCDDESALAALERLCQSEDGSARAIPLPIAVLLRWLINKLLDSLS